MPAVGRLWPSDDDDDEEEEEEDDDDDGDNDGQSPVPRESRVSSSSIFGLDQITAHQLQPDPVVLIVIGYEFQQKI